MAGVASLTFPTKRERVTIASGASVSDGWTVKEKTGSMQITIPVALDAASFWRLQALVPNIAADGTATWLELYMNNSAASPAAMSQQGDGAAQFSQLVGSFVFPYNQYGSLPLRIKTAVNQTALREIWITFDNE